jgi:TetR/AcrR family transcriptional regulator
MVKAKTRTLRKPRSAAASKARGAVPSEDDTRSVILEAALQAFSRDGFDGASLPKIARTANVGHPLIHYYFGSKDTLWRETVKYAFGGLISEASTIDSASRDLTPLDRLRVLIRTFTLFAARYPSHLGLIMSEARADTERLTWLKTNFIHAFGSRLRNILVEAQVAKQIKPVPLEHLGPIILGGVVLYFSVSLELPKNVKPEKLANEHADWVIDAILNGIVL